MIITAFELPQDLIVSLTTHHYLAVDILNVVIFPSMSSIRAHQRRLVSYANVINSCC